MTSSVNLPPHGISEQQWADTIATIGRMRDVPLSVLTVQDMFDLTRSDYSPYFCESIQAIHSRLVASGALS